MTSLEWPRLAVLGQLSGVLARATCSPFPSSLAVCQSSVCKAQERSPSGTRGALGEDGLQKHVVFRFADLTENWEWAHALPKLADVVLKNF